MGLSFLIFSLVSILFSFSSIFSGLKDFFLGAGLLNLSLLSSILKSSSFDSTRCLSMPLLWIKEFSSNLQSFYYYHSDKSFYTCLYSFYALYSRKFSLKSFPYPFQELVLRAYSSMANFKFYFTGYNVGIIILLLILLSIIN